MMPERWYRVHFRGGGTKMVRADSEADARRKARFSSPEPITHTTIDHPDPKRCSARGPEGKQCVRAPHDMNIPHKFA